MRYVLAAFALLLPLAAGAFPLSSAYHPDQFCDNDADPVPAFASGRDAAGCLLIDPGNGDPAIPFEFESHNTNENYSRSGSCVDNLPGTVPHEGALSRDCAMVIWDRNVDDYINTPDAAHQRGGDIAFIGGKFLKYLLFHGTPGANNGFGNGWICKSTNSWEGPPGSHPDVDCTGGSTTDHVDSLQLRQSPVDGGWAVWQDWQFVNTLNQNLLFEVGADIGGHANFAFQNVHAGKDDTFGIATNWSADCAQFHAGAPTTFCSTNTNGRFQTGSNGGGGNLEWNDTVWVINTWTTVPLEMQRTKKFIIVNGSTGGPCNNVSGCNGSMTPYTNGWMAPMGNFFEGSNAAGAAGPGTTNPSNVCPNGLIPVPPTLLNSWSGGHVMDPHVFCYTSIEAALADVETGTAETHGSCPDAYCPHEQPPFIQLSDSGWAVPPSGLPPPALGATASTSPGTVAEGTGSTLIAVPTGGTPPYQVTWDTDGDDVCDDGVMDSSSPYTQAVPAFLTLGSKTLKVCVTDAVLGGPVTATTILVVTALCGNNSADGTEECDGSDLGDTASDECDENGYASGTVVCTACVKDFTGCVAAATCGDSVVDPGETALTCFADAAEVGTPTIMGNDFFEWEPIYSPLTDGDIVHLERLVRGQWNFLVGEGGDSEIESVLMVVNDDRDDPRTRVVNSGVYPLCGATTDDIFGTTPCDPGDWRYGTYEITLIPCSCDWDTGDLEDTGCTDEGGEVGPSVAWNFALSYTNIAHTDWLPQPLQQLLSMAKWNVEQMYATRRTGTWPMKPKG